MDINFNILDYTGTTDTYIGSSDVDVGLDSFHNDHGPITKDSVTSDPKIIPTHIGECSLASHNLGRTDVCSNSKTVQFIAGKLGITGDIKSVIEQAKKIKGCGTEKCVVEKTVGSKDALSVFKVEGPRDNKLLNNVNIDRTLLQWTEVWKDFIPYNFNMRDYADHSLSGGYVVNEPDTLATRRMDDNYEAGYRTMACVINSDTYSGQGKHWMALFVDMRGCRPHGTKVATIEFFNSSGNSPVGEWAMWLSKTKGQLESININAEVVPVTNRKQQRSRTECGVYSLFYIWCRLNGIKWNYFRESPVPDQIMFEFRQHLFSGDGPKVGKTFSWDEYTKQVNIAWE